MRHLQVINPTEREIYGTEVQVIQTKSNFLVFSLSIDFGAIIYLYMLLIRSIDAFSGLEIEESSIRVVIGLILD